jgi:hypothetical protein
MVAKTPDPVFVYSFVAWPEGGLDRNPPAVFDLFRSLNLRVEMEFTEAMFGRFRDELRRYGLDLREIERQPKVKSERII